jgi:demethylmenaquinone methyltransferase/2-methoxy-6-polyprenyl-1,4-benzoquinol methylase
VIDAKSYPSEVVRRAYSRRSRIYAKTVAKMERHAHELAIDAARIQPGERVLEVAVGPGITLVKLAHRAGPTGRVAGVDLSDGMLALARRAANAAGLTSVELTQAEAAHLPYEDNSFDVLYNAYMLDLIPFDQMADVLTEFARVLAPGGRLVLLNMSKPDEQTTTKERLYQAMPRWTALYLMGACRPVLTERWVRETGFTNVTRQFLPGTMASEIVLANKPDDTRPHT